MVQTVKSQSELCCKCEQPVRAAGQRYCLYHHAMHEYIYRAKAQIQAEAASKQLALKFRRKP
jgi:hypothetical protein